MPSKMASVSGSEIEMVVPKPLAERMSMRAAHRRDIALDDIHADAAAGHVGDCFGGRKARRENQLPDVGVAHRRPTPAMPFSAALARMRSRFRPPPSSATSITMLPPWWPADRNRRPASVLPAARARFRHLDAVVDAVAHQVGQRIDDALDQALVQFRRGAVGDEVDLLAQLAGQVAHHAREAREHEVHRHHADRHHRFLQVARVAGQLADAVAAGARAPSGRARRCAARSWPG